MSDIGFEEPAVGETLATAELPPAATAAPEPRKRGRPPGAQNKAPAENSPRTANIHVLKTPEPPAKKPSRNERDLEPMVELVAAAHEMASHLLNTDAFIISQDESRKLVTAIANVMDHYGIKFSGKNGAIIGLVSTAGIVYGPRMLAYSIDRKHGKK